MPRPKKDGRYLNLYLDRALHEEFEQFCESLGQTKTVAAERAFRMYMDAMKQNPEQIMKVEQSNDYKELSRVNDQRLTRDNWNKSPHKGELKVS